MLDVMRRGANSWLSKLILGLIIASFVAFGVTSRLTGFNGAENALEVGSTAVSAASLEDQYRRALDEYTPQVGHPLTKEEAIRYGLPNQILTEIVSRATLTEEARLLGLGVSDDAVRQTVADDPTLKGPGGQFDRNMLRRLLYEDRINEDTYVAERRVGLKRQEVVDALGGGLKIPTAMLEVLNRFGQEERTIRYVTLDLPALGEVADPAPDVLAKYFDERKAAFKTPERRVLQVIALDPAKISKADDISETDAKAS